MISDSKVHFGLIGFPLGHSFSKQFYDRKIEQEQISDVIYSLYEFPEVSGLVRLIEDDPQLMGVNVTIPHKLSVMSFLSELSPEAEAVGAVNCIKIIRNEGDKPVLKGHNTDIYGFYHSLKPLLEKQHQHALILGNGGAAKAVQYCLNQLNIPYRIVSRTSDPSQPLVVSYEALDAELMNEAKLIINTTPLGTFPAIDECPAIPYEFIGEQHLLYDLIYNPDKTRFLQKGEEKGAKIKNGYEMLVLQAERNWQIWRQ